MASHNPNDDFDRFQYKKWRHEDELADLTTKLLKQNLLMIYIESLLQLGYSLENRKKHIERFFTFWEMDPAEAKRMVERSKSSASEPAKVDESYLDWFR